MRCLKCLTVMFLMFPEVFDVPDVFDVPGVYPEMFYLCYVIYLIIFNYQLTSLYVLYM